MRTYEIRHEEDGFVFECKAVPPETTAYGWISSFRLTGLSEADAHRAAVFTRSRGSHPLQDLYNLACEVFGPEASYLGAQK